MGGAIFNQGTVLIEASTLVGNTAKGGSALGAATVGAGGGGMGVDAPSASSNGGGFGAGRFPGGGAGGSGGAGGGGGGAGFRVGADGNPAGTSLAGVGGGLTNGLGGFGGFVGAAGGDGSGGGAGSDGIAGHVGEAGGAFGAGGIGHGVLSAGGGGGVGGGGGAGGAGGGGGFGGGGGASGIILNLGDGPGGDGGFAGGGGDGAGNSAGFGGGTGTAGEGGGGAGLGGAIFNMQGRLDIRDCTLTANAAIGGEDAVPNPARGMGGAVFNLTGELRVVGSTLAGNAADSGGAAIYNFGYDGDRVRQAFTKLSGTIAAGGAGSADLVSDAPTTTAGGRLNQASALATVADFDLVSAVAARGNGTIFGTALSADPQLGPLQSNGGPTQTMAPAPTSPAIDASLAFDLTTDQRGQPRPLDSPFFPNAGDGSDIGAVELQANEVPPPATAPGDQSSAASAAAAAAAAARQAFGARTLVTLRLRTARVSADGRVSVVVANANRFAVRATLSGATTRAVAVGRKRRRVTLKARTVDVASGTSKAVALRLPATLRSLLRRHGKLSLRLQAKVRDPAGTTRVVTKAVAPRAARAHRG